MICGFNDDGESHLFLKDSATLSFRRICAACSMYTTLIRRRHLKSSFNEYIDVMLGPHLLATIQHIK
jgi:hypothetical protein